MAYNEQAYKASQKYKAKKVKRVPLDMQISDYELLKAAADKVGEGVNTYIKRAIAERMERQAAGENAQGGVVMGFSAPVQKDNCDSRFTSLAPPDSNAGNNKESALDVVKRLASMSEDDRKRAMGLVAEGSNRSKEQIEEERQLFEALRVQRLFSGLSEIDEARYQRLKSEYGDIDTDD